MGRIYSQDKEGKMKRMVAAVGQTLRDKGFKFLYLNELARQAEVSKPLIKKYFGGVNPLIKVYILQKDYWIPHFEKLKEMPVPLETELKDFYIVTLKEQLRSFLKDRELQRFILWQISESHPLMRSISEKREEEGARLIALADEHFKNTGISFKAIVALLIAGGYTMGLQASTHNSPFCGIDLNMERDVDLVLDTIGRIIEWAWSAAEQKERT